MENKIKRAENLVKSTDPVAPKRQWFQTHQERIAEKARFKLTKEEGGVNNVGDAGDIKPKPSKKKGENQKLKQKQRKKEQKKAKKSSEMTPEERTQLELNKVMLMQARMSKKLTKPKSMRLSNDVERIKKTKKAPAKKSGSAFAEDLTNTSRKSVKKLRHQGTTEKKQFGSKKGKKGK